MQISNNIKLPMDKTQIQQAFELLDQRLKQDVRILVGGGAAMMAAYDIPINKMYVDGVPDRTSMELADFKKEVQAVGRQLKIAQDWLNDYFATFLFVLPASYEQRLHTLYKGRHLEACALGKEELILMKCFAGREKDIPHIRALMRKSVDLKIVDQRIQELLTKKTVGSQDAADIFDDLVQEMGFA
jgi:hypothetical protein